MYLKLPLFFSIPPQLFASLPTIPKFFPHFSPFSTCSNCTNCSTNARFIEWSIHPVAMAGEEWPAGIRSRASGYCSTIWETQIEVTEGLKQFVVKHREARLWIVETMDPSCCTGSTGTSLDFLWDRRGVIIVPGCVFKGRSCHLVFCGIRPWSRGRFTDRKLVLNDGRKSLLYSRLFFTINNFKSSLFKIS